jgi:hypothetical protein
VINLTKGDRNNIILKELTLLNIIKKKKIGLKKLLLKKLSNTLNEIL